MSRHHQHSRGLVQQRLYTPSISDKCQYPDFRSSLLMRGHILDVPNICTDFIRYEGPFIHSSRRRGQGWDIGWGIFMTPQDWLTGEGNLINSSSLEHCQTSPFLHLHEYITSKLDWLETLARGWTDEPTPPVWLIDFIKRVLSFLIMVM